MSTDLKDKPGWVYEDDDKRAAEQERLKQLEEDFEKPAIDDEDRNASETTTGRLKDAEEKPKSGSAEKNDSGLNTGDGDSGGFYNNKGGKGRFSLKNSLSSTRTRVALAVATAIISGFAALTTMAPNLIINNLKELLLGRISNVQMQHQRLYRQKKIHKLKNWFSADGRRAQRVIDEMKLRGYDISFNKSGELIGLTHPSKNFSATGEGIAKEIDDFLETRHPFRTSRWKTKRMEAFYRKFGVKRTSPIDAQKIRAGPDGELNVKQIVDSEMAEGILEGEKVNLDRVDIDRSDRPEDPDGDPARTQIEEELDGAGSEVRKTLDEDVEKLLDGADESELSDTTKALRRAGGGLNDEVGEIAEGLASQGALGTVGSTIKGIASPLDFADRLCIVRNRINGAVKLSRAAKSVKLIRYTMLFVNAADDTRRGRGDSKAIAELMKRVTAEDANGMSIGGSPGFGYMLKSKFSKSKNKALKAPVAVDGTPTGFFGGLDEAFDKIPFMQQGCPFVQNPFAQIGVGLGAAVAGFFSGGSATAGITASKEGLQLAIKEAVKQFTVRSVAVAIGKQIAIELSFEGIMALTEAYIQKELAIPFTGQEKGGELGNILVAGAGTANKQRSLEAGMVPATTTEYAKAYDEYLAWKKEEDSSKSFFERTFATDNTNSLLFNMAVAMPLNNSTALSTGFRSSLNAASGALNPGKLLTSVFNSATTKALAADEVTFDEFTIQSGSEQGQKLATDPAGNPQVILRSDIESIDPVQNEEALVAAGEIDPTTFEPLKESDFMKHIEECIDTPDIYTSIEEDKGDCMAREQRTKQYKAQLAFLDLKDSLDAEFFPEDIPSGDPGAGSGDNTNAPPTGSNPGGVIVGDPYSDTTSVPCAEGTRDIGLQDAYVEGRKFQSRMCSVSNLPSGGQADNPGSSFSTTGADGHAIVNSRVSGAWYKLVQDAAAAGVSLRANSSFRSMPHQQSLWNNNPNTALVARPGYSSHQAGVAIDFNWGGKIPGASCANRATNSGPGYQWLRANASKYGFKQYAAEAWHWDALPVANRCS